MIRSFLPPSRLRSPLLIGLAVAALQSAAAANHDVVVYGGSPAGIVAAVAAAREGGSVVVVEPSQWIGGLVTGGLSRSDVGKEETVGGLAREFFTRAAARYHGKSMWYAEPRVNLETFKAMLREAQVTVVRDAPLREVFLRGRRIVEIQTADGRRFAGKAFIDASYEGDLMAKAGVGCIIGRESRDRYNEALAGYHPMPIRPRTTEVMESQCRGLGAEGPHYVHGTPAEISGLDARGEPIFGVRRAPDLKPGDADGLTQSYNYRLCVTRRPDIRAPFSRPAGYDPARYELLLRLIRAYPGVRFGRLFHLGPIAEGKFDLNAQGLVSTDQPGANTAYPAGDLATRERIRHEHADHIRGMLWFLGYDERVPANLREETNAWGLCRDEFTDNGHWPYALYVREARRMIGEHVMTQRDLQRAIVKPDSVAMGSFVIDCHIVQRILAEDGTIRDEGSFQDVSVKPYQIPFRSLTPKRAECENLLVPVCLSASHIAYCSLRMEPVYMALGHASGIAAAMAVREDRPVQSINVTGLRDRLREQKAVLELDIPLTAGLPGIVADDEEAELLGAWKHSSYGDPLDGSAAHDGDTDKGKLQARFRLTVPTTGHYEVRLAYTSAPNRAGNVPVEIIHADDVALAKVNQKLPPPIDAHFTSLGIYRFTPDQPAAITIKNAGTDGYVSIDALQLVNVPSGN